MKARGLVLAICALALLVVVQPAATAQRDSTFNDAQGDAQGGAPDLTLVTVSNDTKGLIHFRVVTPNQAKLNPDSRLYLEIDTDRNPSTGAPDTLGSDYVFIVLTNAQGGTSYGFARWTGVDWDFDTPYSSVFVGNTNGGVDIAVNRSELGNTSGFNFWVRGLQETSGGSNFDDAPNDGTYSYVMQAVSPAIRAVNVTFQPYPRAGKKTTVKIINITLETGKTARPTSLRCTAKAGNRTLRGSGRGGCTFRLPANSRGKMFSARVTAKYGSSQKTVGPFQAKIK